MRHTALVRVTHWINTLAFAALVISGAAILVAHPRFYWGETGAFGSPAWLELPLPVNLDQSGWGRSLHFLSAWVCVLNGGVYLLGGLVSREFGIYSTLQRTAYLIVVFVLFPAMIFTGLAMSPAVMSAAPVIVAMFGGHQSSRSIHFITANLLILFLIGHVAMVSLSGFKNLMLGMITGRMPVKDHL